MSEKFYYSEADDQNRSFRPKAACHSIKKLKVLLIKTALFLNDLQRERSVVEALITLGPRPETVLRNGQLKPA